jgi:PAS domain S-box-containing protein
MPNADDVQSDLLITGAVRRSPISMVLTDPRLPDNPITYVNRAFEELTLYSAPYAAGRNCRFLQGPETDPDDVRRIRAGLARAEEFEVTVTNYKADGTVFRNLLLIAPIRGQDGEVTAFFGMLRDVTRSDESRARDSVALLRELQHRVKNHLAMIVSMIRVQSRREVTPDSLRSIGRRIEALSMLYDELLTSRNAGDDGREIAAGAYLGRIASVVASLQASSAIRVNVECEDITLDVDRTARLGLLLSEFLTNALEHAFKGQSAGLVEIRFSRVSDGGIRLSVADDGIGMPDGLRWPDEAPSLAEQHDRAENSGGALDTTGEVGHSGVGGSIVAALVSSLGATLAVTRPRRGTIVTVDI